MSQMNINRTEYDGIPDALRKVLDEFLGAGDYEIKSKVLAMADVTDPGKVEDDQVTLTLKIVRPLNGVNAELLEELDGGQLGKIVLTCQIMRLKEKDPKQQKMI
jgi:hypothetical protein